MYVNFLLNEDHAGYEGPFDLDTPVSKLIRHNNVVHPNEDRWKVSKENEIISNENKLLYDYTVEKENYKLLIKRLISTLKREREKNQSNVREEIEQLRLEYLAREENYILDGDKNEIIDIRTELNKLKHQKLY